MEPTAEVTVLCEGGHGIHANAGLLISSSLAGGTGIQKVMTGLFGPVKCSLPDVLCLLAHLGKHIIHTPLERWLAAAAGLQEGQRDTRKVGIGPRLALLNKKGSHRGCLPVVKNLQAASCCHYTMLSELIAAGMTALAAHGCCSRARGCSRGTALR